MLLLFTLVVENSNEIYTVHIDICGIFLTNKILVVQRDACKPSHSHIHLIKNKRKTRRPLRAQIDYYYSGIWSETVSQREALRKYEATLTANSPRLIYFFSLQQRPINQKLATANRSAKFMYTHAYIYTYARGDEPVRALRRRRRRRI